MVNSGVAAARAGGAVARRKSLFRHGDVSGSRVAPPRTVLAWLFVAPIMSVE
jgi:hypothetical protein